MPDYLGGFVGLLAMTQAAGLLCACLLRAGVGARGLVQLTFLALLAMAGITCAWALFISPNTWFIASLALATMILTATIDLSPRYQVAE